MTTKELRANWLKEPPSQMRTHMLQLCDGYEYVMNAIVLSTEQAKQALNGEPITGKVTSTRYRDTNQLQGSRNE